MPERDRNYSVNIHATGKEVPLMKVAAKAINDATHGQEKMKVIEKKSGSLDGARNVVVTVSNPDNLLRWMDLVDIGKELVNRQTGKTSKEARHTVTSNIHQAAREIYTL